MKKFKLAKNDLKSLENSVSMFDNSVIKNGAFDVTSKSVSGGLKLPEFVQLGFGKVTWAQAVD